MKRSCAAYRQKRSQDKIFIIGEAGVNHNGSPDTARALVDAALQAGCDAVKFQTFKTEEITTRAAPMTRYQMRNMHSRDSQYSMLKRLELSQKDYESLSAYCGKRNIIFMSTPFDEASVDFLDYIGMPVFKIPSGEITNMALIRHIANMGRDIILSTGMSYLHEVGKAVRWIFDAWGRKSRGLSLTLLHCVSSYPALTREVNLKAMITLKDKFGLPTGYSDHTLGSEISVAAAAMGACVIEKHFTLSRKMRGPDHRMSLEPFELKAMIEAVRNVEKALGSGTKEPSSCEMGMRRLIRRSLVASRDIIKGELIRRECVTVKRPGIGIPPECIDDVLGRTASADIAADSLIQKRHLKRRLK